MNLIFNSVVPIYKVRVLSNFRFGGDASLLPAASSSAPPSVDEVEHDPAAMWINDSTSSVDETKGLNHSRHEGLTPIGSIPGTRDDIKEPFPEIQMGIYLSSPKTDKFS